MAEGLSLFDSERVNIEAGQAWTAARSASDEQAARLCNEYPNAGAYILSLRQYPRDSIRWLEVALRAARKLGNRQSEGNRLGSLGLAYAKLNEIRKAIDYYGKALTISRELGGRRGEGNSLGNLGLAYFRLGETEKAIEFMKAALKILEEIESPNANIVRGWLEKLRGENE